MLKRQTTLVIIALLALVAGVTAIVLQLRPRHNTAFIKISEVYNQFELKKELEKAYTSVTVTRKNLTDSMEFQVKKLQGVADKATFDAAAESYIRKRQELEKANEVLSKQYEEQIWNQINSYCQSYGKEHGYKYILGAQGSGVLMYADEQEDITEEVIKYINQAYNGKKSGK